MYEKKSGEHLINVAGQLLSAEITPQCPVVYVDASICDIFGDPGVIFGLMRFSCSQHFEVEAEVRIVPQKKI